MFDCSRSWLLSFLWYFFAPLFLFFHLWHFLNSFFLYGIMNCFFFAASCFIRWIEVIIGLCRPSRPEVERGLLVESEARETEEEEESAHVKGSDAVLDFDGGIPSLGHCNCWLIWPVINWSIPLFLTIISHTRNWWTCFDIGCGYLAVQNWFGLMRRVISCKLSCQYLLPKRALHSWKYDHR